MYGYIYKTTNLLNNKIYIGQKKSKIFLADKYLGSGIILKEAIKKDGKENFIVEILDEANSQEELDLKEKYWIKQLNSKCAGIGYNIADGGQWATNYHLGMLNKKQSLKQRQAVSNYMKNRIISVETKQKMSESAKHRPKRISANKGKIWVHRENFQTMISVENLKEYLDKGFKKGMIPKNNLYKQNRKDYYQNGTYVHKDNIMKFIPLSELDTYLKQGFIKGKISYIGKHSESISKAKKGRITITNGIQSKQIKPTEWDTYKKQGFYKCSLQRFNRIIDEYKETPDELREHLKILQN